MEHRVGRKVDRDDALWGTRKAVDLKELDEDGAGLIGRDCGGKQLPVILGFLRGAVVLEGEEHWIQNGPVDAGGVPASVEVAGARLRCNETTVKICTSTSSAAQVDKRGDEPLELRPPLGVKNEPRLDLGKGRVVDAGRQDGPRRTFELDVGRYHSYNNNVVELRCQC